MTSQNCNCSLVFQFFLLPKDRSPQITNLKPEINPAIMLSPFSRLEEEEENPLINFRALEGAPFSCCLLRQSVSVPNGD